MSLIGRMKNFRIKLKLTNFDTYINSKGKSYGKKAS